MQNKIFKPFITLSAFMIFLASCRKWIEVPPPKNSVTGQQVFANARDATKAITGIYIQVMDNNRSLLNGAMTLYGGLASDELYRTSPYLYEDAFTTNSLTDQNPLSGSLYTLGYNWIFLCNNAIRQLDATQNISDSVKHQLQGEATFLRALIYFFLVNLYGDIPLVVSTDYKVTATLPRAPADSIHRQMTTDLQDAVKLLSEDYPTADGYQQDRTRPNRAAAIALLARVYCYNKDWSQAEQAAGLVIDNANYQLETDLDKVFLSGSTEAVWQLQPVHQQLATVEGSLFIPRAGAQSTYAMTNQLLGSFEPGDQRFTHWISAGNDGGQAYFPYKYKLATDFPAGAEYNMVLRLAEQYLIRAESRLMQGNLAGAISDLNIVRRRAGLGGTKANYSHEILQAIWHERQVEFFAEFGHRWLDLKRTGQIDAVLGKEKTTWHSFAALFPIPYVQLKNNPNLFQNPGY